MNFLEHLQENYEAEIINKIISSFESERTHCLILNTAYYDESKLFDVNISKKHPFISNAFYFENQKLGNDFRFKNGVFYIQDAAAMMPVHFLDVKERDIVLDMCASPGGKTIDAAIKLNNTGMIIANELNYERAKTLSSNVEKLGFSNVFVTNNDLSKLYKNYPNTFDKIILDAPCSGSFMFRKNELSKLDWNYNKVLANALVQKELISIAAFMLKPGGTMVYSTCSLSPEENECVIEDFLNTHEDFEIIKIPAEPQYFMSKKVQGAIYLMPFLFEGEGQFITLLRKKGESIATNKEIIENPCRTSIFSEFVGKNFKNSITKNDLIYSYNSYVKLKPFNVLRYGLQVGENKGKVQIPSFHLAHYVKNDVFELDENTFNKYIKGEEISINCNDGFHVVSYKNINLGFVKVKNNIGKNYYPKGLRN